LHKVLEFSKHATLRAAQRNLSDSDVQYILDHGTELHCGGAVHVFLAKKDILQSDMSNDSITRLIGATLVIDPDEVELYTLYRNSCGLRDIRKKAKYDSKAA